MVLVDFFVTYDVYQDVSNKSNSTFDVSSNVVANLSSTLPNQENHKMFGATILWNHHSLHTTNQTVFGILQLFMPHLWKVALF